MFQPLLQWCIVLLIGVNAYALPYDHTASVECLAEPHRAQYNGGIIKNPELNYGLKGWSKFGNSTVEHRQLRSNNFIVAHNRVNSHDSFSQDVSLLKDMFYTFSAWIQVTRASATVKAVFKTKNGYQFAGDVIAKPSCWSMIKGGLTVDESGPAQLYFESDDTSVEIWVDSISLQPFTEQEWTSHQDQSIEKNRKEKVRIQAVDKQGNILPNTKISIEQKKVSFPFGCAINKNILSNPPYQKWFTSRFTVTVFENEMKWYSTEITRGKIDYAVPDSMMQFAKSNNIAVRGHNVLWDDPTRQPSWVNALSPTDLNKAVVDRVNSVMTKYKGQLIGWDVVNENMNYNYFESKLGQNASSFLYNLASKADGGATLFLNDYNTIENSGGGASSPANYIQKLNLIKGYPGNGLLKMGIGLESHFSTPNIPYVRASIDTLAATNAAVWLTEVDVQSGPDQAKYLEQILREAHSHPKVAGIVLWSAWSSTGCYRMCLTDNNFKNLPTGDVVDKLLGEWGGKPIEGTTDSNGIFETSLFHGDYIVKMTNPNSLTNLKVSSSTNNGEDKKPLFLQVKV
ncbi:endo-1,4-beta-xylanase 4-like [Mercurialis annua]|uniref:endo-1,4-beta-xylanase 4-like n=1 Tax=Mercurialis annua TaxID=3986 RepID=UPI00215EADF3|nr:endo-1,4-beta-xylanase 4-like [Mercurialis annua]